MERERRAYTEENINLDFLKFEKMKRNITTYSLNTISQTSVFEWFRRCTTFRTKIVWQNAAAFAFLHLTALGGVIYCAPRLLWLTYIWVALVAFASGMGVTVGAHRLFTHRSFEASVGLRLALMLCFTMAGENCIYVWVRDHRQHHRFSDTDADPHNVNRGFFFSHMGWLMMRKLPAVKEVGKHIDLSDLERDPITMFQKKWYKTLYVIFAMAIPVLVPVAAWGEDLLTSFLMCYIVRTAYILNITWCVNSWAHMFGTRPFDKRLEARQSRFVSIITMGEGWHNFHHHCPWDYRASADKAPYDISTRVIEWAAKRGWARNLRTASSYTTSRNECDTEKDPSHEEKKDVVLENEDLIPEEKNVVFRRSPKA